VAIRMDAELVGVSVAVFDKFNPITISILRARKDEPGSAGVNEWGLRLAGNFNCGPAAFQT
jgi:hypothetical protein